MLEELKKKGKPISPKMQQMADWLDSLEAGQAAGGQPGEARSLRGSMLLTVPEFPGISVDLNRSVDRN